MTCEMSGMFVAQFDAGGDEAPPTPRVGGSLSYVTGCLFWGRSPELTKHDGISAVLVFFFFTAATLASFVCPVPDKPVMDVKVLRDK